MYAGIGRAVVSGNASVTRVEALIEEQARVESV